MYWLLLLLSFQVCLVSAEKDQNNEILDELRGEDSFEDVLLAGDQGSGGDIIEQPGAFKVWNKKMCTDVVHLFGVTSKAIQSMKDEVARQKDSVDPRTQYRVQILSMLTEELVQSERWIFSALHILKETVRSSASNSLDRILKTSRSRLEELELATMLEEEKCLKITELINKIRVMGERSGEGEDQHNLFYDIIKDVLQDVESAADVLEDNLRDKLAPINSHHIETVKKLSDPDGSDDTSSSLEDVHGNRYVISLPADKTQPLTDHTLLYSILVLLLLAGVFSAICHSIFIPTMFGQMLCGVVLGPSVLNLILDPVQVETVGELGVFLILFTCGLEFSPGAFVKVWRISILGSLSIITLLTIVFTLCGSIFNISPYQCGFVALCLSFSSTALIIKYLKDDRADDVNLLRDSMLGMLVLQDIEVSFMMGLLPLFATHKTPTTATKAAAIRRNLLTVGDESQILNGGTGLNLLVMLILLVVCVVGRRFFLPLLRYLNRTFNAEIETLLPLSLCCSLALLSGHLGGSMEVGCFLAGTIIKKAGRGEETLKLIEPVRDTFAAIFFSSLGLHVYPSFVWSQLSLIIVLTLFVVSIKYLVCLLVLQPLASELQRSVISAGLAQISEFSFVLASRGRKLRLINREVYLLILSLTATSLVFSPLIWKSSLFYARTSSTARRITEP